MQTRNRNNIKRSALTTALLATLVAPGFALAQNSSEATASDAKTKEKATNLDRIEVTGSRIKRADVEGPAPVVVLTAEDIEKEGFTTVYEALNTLSQFTGSVQNELTQNGFTPNAQFINLRSMGPGYTLILINGKRMADYPVPYNSQSNAVSLSSIPAAAIQRIETLTGGASAIYGSDAVAGVINIITKQNYEGNTVRVRGGTTTRGGGDTGQFQWTGGKSGDKWSLTYAFEQVNREDIQASQRDFMDSYYDNPQFKGKEDFATAASGVYLYRNTGAAYNWLTPQGTLSTSVDALRYSCERTSSEFTPYNSSASVSNSTPNRCGYFGYPATQSIQNKYDKTSAYLSGTYDFDNGIQAYAQFLGTTSHNQGNGSTQFWSSGGWFYTPKYGYLQAQRIITPTEVGSAQKTTYDEKSYNFSGGLRGSMFSNRFDWDASLSYSRFEFDSTTPRFLTDKVDDYFKGDFLGYQGPYPAHNFTDVHLNRLFSPMSPDTFNSLITKVRNSGESESYAGQFSLSGDLFDLPAGPLGAAMVLEAAHQEYKLTPDVRSTPDYQGSDSIYNLTATGGGGERDRYAVGLEFSIPIFDKLKGSLAGRYDKYDDATNVGGAFTWSTGLEYRPFDSLLLRGTYATSFRAPDMHYVFAGYSGAYTYITDAYLCRKNGISPTSSDCANDPDYYYQVFRTYEGKKDLQEETSKSFTVGFVWDIMDRMSLSVDYYKMKLENQVGELDSDYLMRQYADCRLGVDVNGNAIDSTSPSCQHFLSLVERDEGSAIASGKVLEYGSYPINQSSLETSGIDASFKYTIQTDRRGDFGFGLDYTHVLTLDLVRFGGDEPLNIRDHLQYFNQRSRGTARFTWNNDNWNTTIYGTRWGSLPNWGETGRIAPYLQWNLDVNRKITDKLAVGLSVTNVFDKLHPNDSTYTTYPYFWRAFSPVGRQVFANIQYTF